MPRRIFLGRRPPASSFFRSSASPTAIAAATGSASNAPTIPISVAPAISANNTTDDGNRSARPYTSGTSTRLSNSSYASISASTIAAMPGPRPSAATTAGRIVSSAPTYGSTSARPPKTASASAFGTPNENRTTNMKTAISVLVINCPRM